MDLHPPLTLPLARQPDEADARDDAADARDGAGQVRDRAADARDRAATARDDAADARDREVPQRRFDDTGTRSWAHLRADATGAADDRRSARSDRHAGANERGRAGADRGTASADRGAAAREREHASLDGLTGAYVRSAGMLQLEREVLRAQRSAEPLVVAFVDVDHLKAVNDAGGHAAGDRLLVAAVDALRSRLRLYDLVIRYGGDEFLCVLPGMPLAEAERRFLLVNEDLAPASVSFGATEADGSSDVDALVERADRDLYARRSRTRAASPWPVSVAWATVDTPTTP